MKPRRTLKIIGFLLLGLSTLLSLLIIRSFIIRSLNPLFAAYSLFVIIYIGSRIIASFFYRPYKEDKPAELPDVSFIIPVYNEEKVIESTIRRCFEVDYPKDKLEVVVVNDGSKDRSWEIIERLKKTFPKLTALNLKVNKGKRTAMATAAAYSNGEIVIQLDSDSYLENNSLKNLIYIFKNIEIAGVSAHTDPENKDENILTKIQASYYFWAFRIMKAAESSLGLVFCCSGCCSAYRREYLIPLLNIWVNEKHLGVKTIYGDDRAITNLLIKQGYKTTYCSTAQAYTIVPENLKKLFRQQRRWKQGWIVNTLKISFPLLKIDPFIALLYIFPQIIVNIFAPAAVIYVIYLSLVQMRFPFLYSFGLFLLYFFYLAYYSMLRQDRYRPYLFLWAIFNILLNVVIFPWAVITIRTTRWGTR